MWPERRLTELFEIEQPLVLAPMGLGTVGLAASVCKAGYDPLAASGAT